MLSELPLCNWAKGDQVAWITHSLGAQRTLSFLGNYPEFAPAVLVRLSGGWVQELDSKLTNNSTASWSLNSAVWLLHGELDEIFPAADVNRLAQLLRAGNARVRVDIFRGYGHNFGPDQNVLWRAATEYCAAQFGQLNRIRSVSPPSLWYYWVPVGVLWVTLAGMVFCCWFKRICAGGSSPAVTIPALAAFGLATATTAIQVIVPQLPLRPSTAKVARKMLVQPRLQNDFDWLADHLRQSKATIDDVLDHVTLGDLQRAFFKPSPNVTLYRNYVLNANPAGQTANISWRRPLWEYFYPRIRRETDKSLAAKTVVCGLRARVTIVDRQNLPEDVTDAWQRGITTPDGFEKLYVAALRAVGLPARLNENGQAEYWTNSGWEPAPRPILQSVIGVNGSANNSVSEKGI